MDELSLPRWVQMSIEPDGTGLRAASGEQGSPRGQSSDLSEACRSPLWKRFLSPCLPRG